MTITTDAEVLANARRLAEIVRERELDVGHPEIERLAFRLYFHRDTIAASKTTKPESNRHEEPALC